MNVFAAFGAGLLASLSPCVYPLIPVTLGYLGAGQRNKALLCFVLGQWVALVMIGMAAVGIGETLGFSSQMAVVQLGVGLFLFLFGYSVIFGRSLILGRLQPFMARWNTRLTYLLSQKKGSIVSAFFFGFGSILVLSPCTSPILGSILTYLATEESFWKGFVLMGFYALGFCFIFLLLAAGVTKISALPKSGPWLERFHQLGGWLLMITGIYFFLSPFVR